MTQKLAQARAATTRCCWACTEQQLAGSSRSPAPFTPCRYVTNCSARGGTHPGAAGVAGDPVSGGFLSATAQGAGVPRHVLRVVALVVQQPLLQRSPAGDVSFTARCPHSDHAGSAPVLDLTALQMLRLQPQSMKRCPKQLKLGCPL